MPEPYDSQTAIEKIREILLNDGYLKIRDHCYVRMGERTVDDVDIRLVLEENGIINSKPEWDKKHQKFKYKVNGYDTDAEKISVIVNIIEETWRVIAVTVIARDW
ncbi:MAG: DUF4258 domain-containing protein [Pyrinomonadaceae bacterium]|nr:DUF4258 domain-containing protein [Pyrinomonadaceae bacterium]